jgi:hypothetical protein
MGDLYETAVIRSSRHTRDDRMRLVCITNSTDTTSLLPSGLRSVNDRGLRYLAYWRESGLFYNYICEIADHANVSMLDDDIPDEPVPAEKIADLARAGISNFGNIGSLALGGYLLLDDADAINFTPGLWANAKKDLEVKSSSLLARNHAAHPMIVLDGTFMQIDHFSLPVGVDWIAIECYGRLGNDSSSCKRRFDSLVALLPADASVWIIMPTETEFGDEDFLVDNARAIYNWARGESRAIGLIGFVWQSELLATPQMLAKRARMRVISASHRPLATRDLPKLKATMLEIGRQITGRSIPGSC